MHRTYYRRWWRSMAIALATLALSTGPAGGDSGGVEEPKLGKPLLAHWTFNDPPQAARIAEAAANEALAVPAAGIERIRGVHGNAVNLQGRHRLEVRGLPSDELEAITFSAWAMPADLSGYREIFRRERPNRLLFSFQNNGTILSLGLDIGGYVECDAQISPAAVLDGTWHHCAATFDGRAMRVYLDGKEIASLDRPGKVATRADVPGFIGSSGGAGEHFQGGLDDLRIYAAALSGEEIGTLYRAGLEAILKRSAELQRVVQTIRVPANKFSQALAGTRKVLLERAVAMDRELAGAVVARLKSEFPEDSQQFFEFTGSGPVEYLSARGNEFHLKHAGRLIDLLLEYQPLTEHQWKSQTPQQLLRWKEAEAIRKRFDDLAARGDEVKFSPEWIDVMLDAGRRIDFRPAVSEAVAPYRKPETPQTRSLTAEEAREVLRRDWLHQAGQTPTPERIRAEIRWTRQLAARIASPVPRLRLGTHCPAGSACSAGAASRGGEAEARSHAFPGGAWERELAELEQRAAEIAAPDHELYFRVRELKRSIMLSNPVVDFDKILLVDMPYPDGKEWRHETRHRLGYMAVPGGRLLVLEGLSPEGKLRQLMPQPPLHGSFWRPDLSFDAKKVLVSFKPHNEKSFHLYEIHADGTGLVQLTDGPYDDLDPIYLPDGHLLFSTTRAHTYVRCMPPTNAFVLARCDRDGKNIYLVSQNNEPDYLPSLMHDGRVIYTRWEYTDKPLWRAQGLWTVNPDGTQVSTFWGNQSVWPDLLKDARSIPGSRRVMFTGSAHHDWFSGSIGILDPDKGYNFPDGLTKVTADVAWPESGNGPTDPIESPDYHPSGAFRGYYSPYPLGERDFLVSAERNGKFLLYLMDVHGNRELIYEGVHNIFHAQPLRPRPRPPVIADRVAWPSRQQRLEPQGGVIYSGNVYHGAPPELRSRARWLRVLTIEPKTYTYWYKRPYISTGPVVSAVQSEGVKRILGTVAIETDGSVAFQVPPGKSLHFQLLDEKHLALQTMRSFVGTMPGEKRGCLGCHELHSTTPMYDARPIALTIPPQAIAPPPWGDDTVSYARYVQPVLDRYCGKCHQGDGEGRKTLDLTERPGFLDFCEPYLTLIGRPTWGKPYEPPANPMPGFGIANMLMVEAYSTTDPQAYQTPAPMTKLSYKSPLIERCSSGTHHDVKVDPLSLQRLIAWVDAMCPYLGDEEVRQIDDPVFQGVDWLSVRPKIKNAPRIVRPGPVD